MINRSAVLSVMLVATVSLQEDSLSSDPAINLGAKGVSEALTRYARTRSDEDRAKVPMLPNQRPTLFKLSPMSVAAVRWCKQVTGEERAQRVVACICHEFVDEKGTDHRAADFGKIYEEEKSRFAVAPDEWLQHIADLHGNGALRELAQVALDRAEASPRALSPFRLPAGSMLPR
ncbi:MAG: hypothetical protein JWM10_3013 [Myxococcaceae bacterium]|nr:hypothetical protein [Myxococcaceae bacterium]